MRILIIKAVIRWLMSNHRRLLEEMVIGEGKHIHSNPKKRTHHEENVHGVPVSEVRDVLQSKGDVLREGSQGQGNAEMEGEKWTSMMS